MKDRRFVPAAVLGVFFLPLLAELLGLRLLVFRDAFITHLPAKLQALSILRAGDVPFLNFSASNVEPLLSNPNTVTLYPTSLLFFLLPAAAAFNLHLLFHVAWAFFGAARLCRRFGAGRSEAWIGGAVYAFGGPFLSYAAAFTNASAAAAWAPWAVACAVDLVAGAPTGDSGARRAGRGLALGIAFGLQLLAGEPAISVWTAAASVAAILVWRLEQGRRSFLRLPRIFPAAIATVAVSVALSAPLLLSTAAAIPYSFRGEHSFSREQFNAAANVPARALETLFPLVFGSPRPLVSGAFWAYRLFGSLQPYLYSANFGLAAFVLVLSAFALRPFRSSARVWGLAALTIVFLALSFGFSTPLFEPLYAVKPLRHFRYPIKFLLPSSLFFAVLSSLAIRVWRQVSDRRRLSFAAALFAAPLLAGIAASTLGRVYVLERLRGEFADLALPPERVLPGIFRIVLFDSLLGLAAMILLWISSRKPGSSDFVRAAFAAVLLGLLPSGWPLFVSAPADEYLRPPELASQLSPPGRLWVAPIAEFAVAKLGARQSYAADDVVELILSGRRELWPLTAAPEGVRYSFDKDPDGSYGWLDRLFGEAIGDADPAGKSRMLRSCSVRYALASASESLPDFHPRARMNANARVLVLFEADRTVPEVRLATRIFRRSSASGAIDLIKSGADFDLERDAVLRGADSDPLPPGAEGSLVLSRRIANGFEAETTSSGDAVGVFAATYFPYWKGSVDGVPARVEVANGNLCGIRVGAGRHRLRLFYDERPFRLGAAGNAIFLGVTILVLLRFRKRPSLPSPEA